MQWIEVKVICEKQGGDSVLELLADFFYDLGLRGVVLDDPLLQPAEGWAEDAVALPTQPAVAGYIADNRQAASTIGRLREKLQRFEVLHGIRTHLVSRKIDEQDWAESWKTFFNPVKVTDMIVIKPTWKTFNGCDGQIVIEIDPGMAFGTGTHPTTVMCLQMLQKHLKPGGSVLDVGTGSGILMIAAARLGAGTVVGIDNDDVALQVASANLALNRVDAQASQLIQGNLLEPVGRSFNLVIANLLTDIIIDLLGDIPRVIKPGGLFICSGIFAGHLDSVLDAVQAHGLQAPETLEQEEWICLALKIPAA